MASSQELEEKDKMLFLGEPLPLRVVIDSEKKESFKIADNEIIFTLHKELSKERKEAIRAQLYKYYAPKYLLSEVASLENKMNLKASRVSFRKTKSQWGSCSHKNAISLNSYLLLLPKDLREYIIVHELSHIVHKNHSKEFWMHVSKYYPEYKEARVRLKEFAYFLRL